MIVGIDLGTTNSAIAVFEDGVPRVLPNALGQTLTPSVVGLDDDGSVLTGLAARERLITRPQLTIAAFKRLMGSDRITQLGNQTFRPEELSALILKSLKADAEAALGTSVREAVITVPAYFSDAQRKATRIAGELAGLRVERLLNEPSAAALAYGLHARDLETRFLMFDLGGGTFDVSLLELFEGVIEVRASAGDNFLGGEDFVARLMDGFVAHHECPKLLEDRAFRALLREQAERAKRKLSESPTAELALTWKGCAYSWTVDETAFEALAQPLLERLRAPVERSLRDAKIRSRDLDEVILVGGATRMPIVRRMVARMFGRIPSAHLDPDHVVAMGAAVQAALKARDVALHEVVMTDVAPYSLGIAVAKRVNARGDVYESGHYLPIIERNTAIPVSRVERVCTVRDQQRALLIEIFQGESRLTRNNILLGKLDIKLPPRPAGEEAADVRFTYDINGLLEVEVTVASSQQRKRTVIEGNPGVLTPAEVEHRLALLATLKIHPRDQSENRAVVARAERLYEESLGEQREAIGDALSQFSRVLAQQDPRRIQHCRRSLVELLDSIEGAPYL